MYVVTPLSFIKLADIFHIMWKIVSDPERPKNDKVTILSDAIQMLKDLTAQINTLKAEYNSLSEESHEVN